MTSIADVQPPSVPPGLASRLSGLLRRRATWVLIDQGVASAGNFLTVNLLARRLPQSEYGVFNVLLETMLYLGSLQAALIIYPLTIKGATGDRDNLGRLATGSVVLTLVLLPILGAATAVSVFALHNWQIAIWAVAALLMWQVQETLRRALMADLRFAHAVWGDAVRYLGQTAVVFGLVRYESLDLNRAFAAMSLTAAAATLIQGWQVGLKPIRPWQLRLVIRDFWRLGRWMLLSNASGLITSLGFWWILQWRHGAAACGVFAAIALPFKLANPVMSSMTGLILPAVARASARQGMKAATRTAVRYIILGAVILLPYFLLLAIFPSQLLKLLYSVDSPYVEYGHWMRLFVANYVTVYFLFVLGAWLSALSRARWNFYAQVANIFATLLVGLPFTAVWGVPGVIVGGLVAAGSAAAATIYFIYRAMVASRQHEQNLPPSPGSE